MFNDLALAGQPWSVDLYMIMFMYVCITDLNILCKEDQMK